jgi:hypothetical protein
VKRVGTPVPARVCVSYQQGNRGKHGLIVRAKVACDLPDRTAKEIEAHYQKRSAIATAFRTTRKRVHGQV